MVAQYASKGDMPAAPSVSTRVPAEFVGRARLFRTRIEAADAIAIRVIHETSGALVERMKRHPVPRADTLSGIARAWRTEMPPFGRIGQDAELSRKSLRITETRLSPQHYRSSSWETDAREPGVAVVALSLGIAPHTKLALSIRILAGASLHAIARRIERGGDASDAAIIADLAQLADAYTALARQPEGSSFNVRVADGRWLGSVLDVRCTDGETQRLLSARTFVAGD